MPLDSSFPTFHYEYDKEEPSIRRISYTSAGSTPQTIYTLSYPNPDPPANSYLLSLHDASFPEIQYGTLAASLEFKTQTPPAPPKPQLPRTLTLTLINPTSTLTLSESSSYRRGGRYWKFRLAQRVETRSAEEIAKDPVMPVFLDFRWTTSTGRLHCWLKGRGDPDTQLATFSGVGKKKAMLEIYGSNVARLDMDDKKGLEMVLVLSARAISDVYYTPMSVTFNVAEAAPGVAVVATPPVMPGKKAAPTAIFDPDEVARQKEAAKREAEELERVRRMVEMEEREERRREEERRRKEEEELEAVRELLRREEEEERRRRREEERRVEEETERLRLKYMAPPRPGRGAPPQPPRPRERGEGSGGSRVSYLTAEGVVEDSGRRLKDGDRRKSFFGGLLGGGQGKKMVKKKQSGAW